MDCLQLQAIHKLKTKSTLTLLVARLAANDANHALALDDPALATNLLYRGLNTHVRFLFKCYLAR
jgi:hypothetical protein